MAGKQKDPTVIGGDVRESKAQISPSLELPSARDQSWENSRILDPPSEIEGEKNQKEGGKK